MFCVTKKNKICQLPPVTAGGMSGFSSNATLCKGELIQQSKLLFFRLETLKMSAKVLYFNVRGVFFWAFDASKTVHHTRK